VDAKEIEVIVDSAECDARHNGIVVDIVQAIEKVLTKAGLPEKQVEELTADIGFDVCSVLDNSYDMIFAYEDDDDERELPLIPSLGFFADEQRTKLIVSKERSCMHEYVHGHIDILEND